MPEDGDIGSRSHHVWPQVIQGGMGVGVSGWRLARAVAQRGHMGVVSGSLLDTVFVRRLQDGDQGGHMRRAMAHFPLPAVAERAARDHFRDGGRAPGEPYKLLPVHGLDVTPEREALTILAGFCEVWLAREGHDGLVGMNLLTKAALPNAAFLYGAMLAGVHVILMGAGIPRDVPAALDALAEGRPSRLKMDVESGPIDDTWVHFDPAHHFGHGVPRLERPRFLAIVSSHLLAGVLAKKASGRVDGFVVESHIAGGHNAPPREGAHDTKGEPVYGERDVVDLAKLRALGLPFWLAGGTGSPEALIQALEQGAAGVQVGSLFAFSDESGIEPTLKRAVLAAVVRGDLTVHTDPLASPTGYPFKIARWPGGPTEEQEEARERICDLGALRLPFRAEDGSVQVRCPAAPLAIYTAKGGKPEQAIGRRCLCNGLLATVGQAQVRDGVAELPMVTAGDELKHAGAFLGGRTSYSAGDVLDWLLGGVAAER